MEQVVTERRCLFSFAEQVQQQSTATQGLFLLTRFGSEQFSAC